VVQRPLFLSKKLHNVMYSTKHTQLTHHKTVADLFDPSHRLLQRCLYSVQGVLPLREKFITVFISTASWQDPTTYSLVNGMR